MFYPKAAHNEIQTTVFLFPIFFLFESALKQYYKNDNPFTFSPRLRMHFKQQTVTQKLQWAFSYCYSRHVRVFLKGFKAISNKFI